MSAMKSLTSSVGLCLVRENSKHFRFDRAVSLRLPGEMIEVDRTWLPAGRMRRAPDFASNPTSDFRGHGCSDNHNRVDNGLVSAGRAVRQEIPEKSTESRGC